MAISPMTRAGPPVAPAILFSFELHVYCCTFCGSLLKPSKTCLFLIGAVRRKLSTHGARNGDIGPSFALFQAKKLEYVSSLITILVLRSQNNL